MTRLILAAVFTLSPTISLADAPTAKHYQVFRTDNEHCFAIDAKRTIYRIDDVNFKCSETAQPNPDTLEPIATQGYLGDVITGKNSSKMNNMVMGNIVDLGGVKNNTYLYRTARGQKNGQPVFENYFVNTNETTDGRFNLSVSVVRFEYDGDSATRTNRLGTNYLQYTFNNLAQLPPLLLVDVPAPMEPIVVREINIPALAEQPTISVNTELPMSEVPVFREQTKPAAPTQTEQSSSATVVTPYTQPQVVFIYEKEQKLCSNILKRYGRKLADQDCSQIKNENTTQTCFLQNHCNFEKGCNSEKCVSQYIEMGQLDDVESLMKKYKEARRRLNQANAVFNAAQAKLKDCDTLDKDSEERKKRAKAVEDARIKKNVAQKQLDAARKKLDDLVQAKMQNSTDRYSCMKLGESTFRFFYDSWVYILDYKERYWTCVMGPKESSKPSTTKKTVK